MAHITSTTNDQSVELTIGGYPRSQEQTDDAEVTQMLQNLNIAENATPERRRAGELGNDSTAWNIQIPGGTAMVTENPGYSFGTNESQFIYPPPRQFGMDQVSNQSSLSHGTTTPRGTPRTPQRHVRESPPHQVARDAQSGTPPGLNQTGVRFANTTVNIVTSTAQQQKKGKDVLRLPEMTRGTTKIVDPNSTSLQHERVQVDALTEVDNPLEGILTNPACYSNVRVDFFACMEDRELENYPIYASDLVKRKKEALHLGRAYLAHRKFRSEGLSQSIEMTDQEYNELKESRIELNGLLTHLDRYEDEFIIGYRVNAARYKEFNKNLLELRTASREHVILAGEGLQDLPCWGLNGNINEFWEAKDFEILATCYRHEVTRYLLVILRAIENAIPVMAEVTANISKLKTTQITETRSLEGDPEDDEEPRLNESKSMFFDAPTPIAQRVHNFTNQNASIFGNPSKHTSSRKLADMLSTGRNSKPDATFGKHVQSEYHNNQPTNPPERTEQTTYNKVTSGRGGYNGGGSGRGGPPKRPGHGGHGGGWGGSGPGGNKGLNGGGPGGSGSPGGNNSPGGGGSGGGGSGGGGDDDPGYNIAFPPGRQPTAVPQFDYKLKVDMIPTWNGNPDDLARWIIKVNRLSERSRIVFQQLGYLVPTRLTGPAELWYYSQSAETRAKIEEDWGQLRAVIAGYYMNRSFLEKQRIRANKARYRDLGHNQETPSEYFIRKLELLEIVYNYSEGELINEIMAGAPTYWSTVLTPHLYDTIEGFQMAIKFQEDNLLRMGYDTYRARGDSQEYSRNPFNNYRVRQHEAKVNAIGWSQATMTPPFPKDDANVSPRGSPVSKGGRPCRHCGSDNHWDPECKHARKGEKRARVNAVAISQDDIQAQQDYDDLFYSMIDDDSEAEDFH